MELTLTRQTSTHVAVVCDDQHSHSFDLLTLIPDEKLADRPPQPLHDPIAYGKALYHALFPANTPARQALDAMPERILLVTLDDAVQALPWEYVYGPDGFIVLDCHFVRGLPTEQRIDPPLLDSGLHIVAVPSNPLAKDLAPLIIEGEWLRLTEVIQDVPAAMTVERTRPPTLEQVRRLV